MNIMAFRGSLGNYMAVMVLSFNRIFRLSIYLGSLGGKSIKLFTFAVILYVLACCIFIPMSMYRSKEQTRHALRVH